MTGWSSENRSIRLSAVLIVQNEARHLNELLPQLGFADEVVIVDGGSHDDTAAVARRHGARVVARPFDHFAAQRNFAARQARGQWILSLDADERPAPGFAGQLPRVLATTCCAALRVPIRSRIFGRTLRYSGTQDDDPIRLFRRGRAVWRGEVHERLHVYGRIGRLRHGLMHDTLPTLAAFLTKMHRYTALEAAARTARGQAPRRGAAWWAPCREVFRRLVWKHGWLDGPAGWAFCLLSGLSEWVLQRRHQQQWQARLAAQHRARVEAWAPALFDGTTRPASAAPPMRLPIGSLQGGRR